MFAGHIGAALAIGRAEHGVNVGLFIAAALMLDVLLWLFVLIGWESVAIPENFAATHQAEFVFPFSHGLLASVVWSGLAAVMGSAFYAQRRTRWRIGALLALAVLSHWVLDALVHRRELPLAGSASPAVGLGLWSNLPVALFLEAAIVLAGLFVFVSAAHLGRRRSIALVLLTVVLMIFTAIGMTVAPAPPSASAMAASSLATLVVVCALAGWCGRIPVETLKDNVHLRR